MNDPLSIILMVPFMLLALAGGFCMLAIIAGSGGGYSFRFLTKEQSQVLHKLTILAYYDTRLVDRALNSRARYHTEQTRLEKLFNRPGTKTSKYPYSKLDEVIKYIKEHRDPNNPMAKRVKNET